MADKSPIFTATLDQLERIQHVKHNRRLCEQMSIIEDPSIQEGELTL